MSNLLNKVSEIVGEGHPDKIADFISERVGFSFDRFGVETLIRYNELDKTIHLSIYGDVAKKDNETLENSSSKLKIDLRYTLWQIWKLYKKNLSEFDKPLIDFNFVFCIQNEQLNERSYENVSGDQEVIFLLKHALHDDLKKIKKKLDLKFPWLDWKLLINKEHKIINFSCSKTPYDQQKVQSAFIKILKEFNYHDDYDIQYCWFEGGSFFNDVGVTGRKLIADGDGCGAPHGGGAWSGKDKTKAAVVGREYLERNNIEGVAIYIPTQDLNKPTIIKK